MVVRMMMIRVVVSVAIVVMKMMAGWDSAGC